MVTKEAWEKMGLFDERLSWLATVCQAIVTCISVMRIEKMFEKKRLPFRRQMTLDFWSSCTRTQVVH